MKAYLGRVTITEDSDALALRDTQPLDHDEPGPVRVQTGMRFVRLVGGDRGQARRVLCHVRP